MNHVFVSLCLIVALFLSSVQAGLTWTNCGQPEDLLQLQSLDYFPSPPQRNQFLNVTLKGQLNGVIDEGAKVNLAVKWGYVRIPVPAVDVCKELNGGMAGDAGLKCPVPSGELELKQGFMLPGSIPDVSVGVRIILVTVLYLGGLCRENTM